MKRYQNPAYGLLTLALIFAGLMTGCGGDLKQTGFLSDYSKLDKDGSILRYMDQAAAAKYSKFIFDPVNTGSYSGKADKATVRRLANLMHSALFKELAPRYTVVSQPGPGIARLRIAITDLKKDTPALNVLPQTRMTGVGLGGASMEAEAVDSVSGEQFAAVIRSDKGGRISLAGYKDWSSAESVIKGWAKSFREHLDQAYGREK